MYIRCYILDNIGTSKKKKEREVGMLLWHDESFETSCKALKEERVAGKGSPRRNQKPQLSDLSELKFPQIEKNVI